jgi:hypothetical protein
MNETKFKLQCAKTCLASGSLLLCILLIELPFVNGEFLSILMILITIVSLIMLFLIAHVRISLNTCVIYNLYGYAILACFIFIASIYLYFIFVYRMDTLTDVLKLFICAVLTTVVLSGVCILFVEDLEIYHDP